MSVGFVAGGNILYEPSGASMTPSIPSGSNGDLLVLLVATQGTTGPNTPSGWNIKYSAVGDGDTSLSYFFHIYWRIRDGSEGSTVTVNGPNFGITIANVTAWSGVNSSAPIGAFQWRRPNVNTSNFPAPGLYLPAGAGCLVTGISDAGGMTSAATLSGDSMTWAEIGERTAAPAVVLDYGLTAAAVSVSEKSFTITGGTSSTGHFGFTLAISPADIEDRLIHTTGGGSLTAPSGASAVRMQCTGGGGGGSVSNSAEGGGGGGGYAETNSVTVTGGSTTVYYSVGTGGGAGTAGNDSWARKDTNSAPSSATDGCMANGGGSTASGQTGGTGGDASTGVVGDFGRAGGNGATGQGGGGNRAGSGGGSAAGPVTQGNGGTAGSGSTIGVGGAGVSQAGAGGNGGASGAAGVAGEAPGGGGGGGGNSGGNAGAGARGQVRLIFTLSAPVIGRADETDTASARGIAVSLSRSNETDSASAIFPKVVIGTGQINETDSAFRLATALQPQRANETDLAFALSQGIIQVPVGMAAETDTAFKAGGISMAPNRPVETDSAFNRGTVLQVQRANETDTAFERPRQSAVGVSLETDTAFALGGVFIKGYTHVNETDSAFALARLDTPAWTRSNETDSAFARVAGFPVVRSNETDLAFARTGVFIRATGSSTEAETAFALTAVVVRPALRADETCTASRLGFGSPAVVSLEADTAFARNALITIDHGFSEEIDTAFQMFGALSAGSGRKPHLRFDGLLRDRIQPVYKGQ